MWAAAVRARESERPDRLFADPLAAALAGEAGMRILRAGDQANRNPDAVANFLAIRTRFSDDLIAAEMQNGVRQVVSLAAGMDTRAFRLEWPQGATFYEVDRAELLEAKAAALARAEATPGCNRVTVAADLGHDWQEQLEANGFCRTKPAVWILEGILQYLDVATVERALRGVSELSAAGSTLSADLPSGSFLHSKWTEPARELFAAHGMPMRFGSDEPNELLADHGWKTESFQLGEAGANYGRWGLPIYPRRQLEVPRYWLIRACKLDATGRLA